MGFLTPLFLAGLAALAVPVLVHLTHRTRNKTVPFPSLMFLQRIPYKSSRRQTLRNWLLFALRCAAFALLALAFARPFTATPSQAATAPPGAARARVVLLDRSGSMAYGGRWQKARDAARRALNELGAQDKGTLVLFDHTAQSSGEPTGDRAKLVAQLDAAQPGFGATRYAAALRLAAEALEAAPLPVREAVLITDFQKTGWDGTEEVPLPPGAELRWVDVSGGPGSNVGITGVELSRDYDAGRERVAVVARLVNKGAQARAGTSVALEVDGRTVREQRVDLAANASASVSFEPFPLPSTTSRGIVRASADGLPSDDAFSFVLTPGGDVRALVLEPGAAAGRRSLYLRRALAIGQRPRFTVDVKAVGTLGADDLARASVVVLNDAAPSAAAAKRLRDFVEKGGGLVVAIGDQAAANWPADGAGLLPGRIDPVTDRSADWGGTLAHLDYQHPAFELFRGPRSGDFSSARFFRYRPVPAGEGVIARFDDGAAALVERRIGKGRVLVWTSTFDAVANDLPLQPVFLPFLHQLLKHAAGHVEARPWYTVGEALDLSQEQELAGRDAAVLPPSGQKQRVPAAQRAVELAAPGFYEVRRLEGGSWSALAAVNFDPAESDLAALDPEELRGAVVRKGAAAAALGAGPAPTVDEHESRQALWRYLLAAGFLVLVGETVLSNRRAAVNRPQGAHP
jgi:hypothetical protein